jgi:hypothetical protein
MDITPLETKFLVNITCVGTEARNGYESSAYMKIFNTHTQKTVETNYLSQKILLIR